ncbi:MAG: HEAT repeat domain-containing protein [Deltaproteobacteria bacterium]|nr:HEAT repeat domain-containing protein [Deltaproteobacteria bacterium]
MAGGTGARRKVRQLLAAEDFAASLRELKSLPPEQTLKYLQAGLPAAQPLLKWRAVTALGQVVQGLAAHDLEAAREFLRRLLWCLNEESGAVPWGVAEALGEILANSPELAQEYASLQVSCIWPQGNFIQFGPLLAGAVWGVGRLASAHPELAHGCCALERLVHLLDWEDALVRGTAAWALGNLRDQEAVQYLEKLVQDQSPLEIWDLDSLRQTTVSQLAREAINKIVKTEE